MTATAHTDALDHTLRSAFPDGQLHHHSVVASTMDLARAEAESGAPEGTLILADEQRQGRGRRGRAWASPPGGLWASLVLKPQTPQRHAGCLSVLVAVGLAQGLRERFGLPVTVKWPNDLLIQRRKLGGTLIEVTSQSDRLGWLIVGVGLNVNNPVPDDARLTATSLSREVGHDVAVTDVASATIEGIASAYGTFEREGFRPIQERWATLSALPGHALIVSEIQKERVRVEGLADDGRLIVRADNGIRHLASEEITLEWED